MGNIVVKTVGDRLDWLDFVGAALGGRLRLTHSEYETRKTYSIVSFRANEKQSQTPQTLSFFQTSNIMAEEPAIAETDAILENAQNKHEVSSIFRETKLIERYGMFKSPIKNVMNRLKYLDTQFPVFISN